MCQMIDYNDPLFGTPLMMIHYKYDKTITADT